MHRWCSKGEKRTIAVPYRPSDYVLRYLEDMRDALKYALAYGYVLARERENRVPSPILLRKKIKPWFDSSYNYARHHINPLCRQAVALLRSYKKKHRKLGMPRVERLAMRVDGELFKVEEAGGKVSVRITLKPHEYEYVSFEPRHKKWSQYRGKISELLLTDRKLFMTFVVDHEDEEKPLAENLVAVDLNFKNVTLATRQNTSKIDTSHIARVQRDFSLRRERVQRHVRNPAKRSKLLRQTQGRQRNRVRDALHKLSASLVKSYPNHSFVFENLTNIRRNGRSRRFNRELNRWPYRLFQSMVEYKSRFKTLYVSPRGTSSKCPACGGKLEHPTWGISECKTCDLSCDRDGLAAYAILLRGSRLCGQPFVVSAVASALLVSVEAGQAVIKPDDHGSPWSEKGVYTPNGNVMYESTRS